jgi:phosphotransacetylase
MIRDEHAFQEILQQAKAQGPIPMAVAHPCSRESMQGALEAGLHGVAQPILIGPRAKMQKVADELGAELERYPVIDMPHSHAAAEKAVELVRNGEAEILMKGSLHTDEFMSEVVARGTGIRTDRRLSHCWIFRVESYPRLIVITDAAINIEPDLMTKRDICQNAIDFCRALGIERPKVAILSAVETITPDIRSTIDAAALCKMAERGQITGGDLDGPLAFDNAISFEAAQTKGIISKVAGQPDILLVPDLESGNMLGKQLTYLAAATSAGVVVGARVPIVLTSRSEDSTGRLASAAVANLLAHNRRQGKR